MHTTPATAGRARAGATLAAVAVAYIVGYTAGPLILTSGSGAAQLAAGQALGALGAAAVARSARIPLVGRAGRSGLGGGGRVTAGCAAGAAMGAAAAAAAIALSDPTSLAQQLELELALIATLLPLTLGAALSEELVFRHIAYRTLRYGSSHIRAAALSTLLFTAAHLTQGGDPYRLMTVLLAGTLLVEIYRRWGYLGAVSAHAAFNLTVISSMVAFG